MKQGNYSGTEAQRGKGTKKQSNSFMPLSLCSEVKQQIGKTTLCIFLGAAAAFAPLCLSSCYEAGKKEVLKNEALKNEALKKEANAKHQAIMRLENDCHPGF